VTVHYPDRYALVEETPPRRQARVRGDEAEAVDDREVLSWLQEALEGQELEVMDRIALSAPEGGAEERATRGGAEPSRVAFDVEVAPDEEALVLVEEDGLFRWVLPETAGERGRTRGPTARRADRGEGPRTLRFELELGRSTRGARGDRGLLDTIGRSVAGRVVGWVFRFLARKAVGVAARIRERNVVEGLVAIHGGEADDRLLEPAAWTPGSGPPALDLPDRDELRVLLLVHGTFSSTLGSYGPLAVTAWGQEFLREAAEAYDVVLGFDHATLRVDPEQNALDLMAALEAVDWKGKSLVVDGVGYSRGALVLRSLVESVAPDADLPLRVRRAVFVGGTNGGTLLAEPENWRRLIDTYTNLVAGAARVLSLLGVAGAAPGIVAGMFSSVGSFAKHLVVSAISAAEIPGLAAMEPDGPFVTALNRPQDGQPRPGEISYYAVTSSFDASLAGDGAGLPERVRLALADWAADQLMGVENDLVVDTAAMTRVDPKPGGYMKAVAAMGANPRVHHTVYFVQPETVSALGRWLLGREDADRRDATRGVAEGLPASWSPVEMRIEEAPTLGRRARRPSRTRELRVRVVWGDIRAVSEAQVYAVGHYQGVLPQRAELALDRMVSPPDASPDRLVLTQLTRSGLLQGRLGEIDLFPTAQDPTRQVAVCGMGHPGSFDASALRTLHRNLAAVLNLMSDRPRLATVLIGSGEGSIDVPLAVEALLDGWADALGSSREQAVEEIVIAEIERHKAEEVHAALLGSPRRRGLEIRPPERLVTGEGGRVSHTHRLTLLIAAAVEACRSNVKSDRDALDRLMKLMPLEEPMTPTLAEATLEALDGLARSDDDAAGLARTLLDEVTAAQNASWQGDVPTRMSFVRDRTFVRAAAITQTSTVPERVIDVDPDLITQGVRRMSDPSPSAADAHGQVMARLVVPAEFRALLRGRNPLVVEVDRHTAALHWEMLPTSDPGAGGRPTSLERPVARQLRTGYATVAAGTASRDGLRALVIGDPGDPARGDGLAFARREAEEVADLLHRRGFDVDLMLGVDGARSSSGAVGARPADRFDTLALLLTEPYDLVHYAGHGDYDAEDPSRTGWLFADGLLRAGEIRRVERMPALVFANACLSGQLSRVDAGGEASAAVRPYGEAGLLASLADEFMGRGVRNYIGTAWKVDDQGAVDFALRFYSRFIASDGRAREPMGEALLHARRHLASLPEYRCLWGAYQHYGDPSFTLADV
jgi:hypothetical protein